MQNNTTFSNRESLKTRLTSLPANDTFSNKVSLQTILVGSSDASNLSFAMIGIPFYTGFAGVKSGQTVTFFLNGATISTTTATDDSFQSSEIFAEKIYDDIIATNPTFGVTTSNVDLQTSYIIFSAPDNSFSSYNGNIISMTFSVDNEEPIAYNATWTPVSQTFTGGFGNGGIELGANDTFSNDGAMEASI